MPIRHARTPLGLYLFALAVRAVLVALYPDPGYPDSYHYVDVARALHDGHGFNIDFIWAFVDVGGRIPANPGLPIPSNAHWMPLSSLVQLPFLAVLGTSPLVSMIPFVLIGALAAPLAWAIAREAGASRSVKLGAGLLTAVPAAATVFMGQPDNFSIYMPLGAAVLWLGARGLKGDARAFALAGLLVGLATLGRNDGVLLGLALAIAFVWDRWRAWRSDGTRRPAIPLWAAVACFALFVLIMGPWYARQLAVFGSLSPSSSSGRILWIRSLADMNSVTTDVSLRGFLGQGIVPLAASRIFGFVAAVGNFVIIPLSAVLTPFLVVGAWRRRHSVDFGPFFVYAAILFGVSSLLFAPHVPTGMFLHSAVALLPHTYVLVLEGVAASVSWVAARRRTWDVRTAQPFFIWATIGVAFLTAALGTWKVQEEWGAERSLRLAVDAKLDSLGASMTDRLMSADAAGFKYFTGRPGVVTVGDDLKTIQTIAVDYKIRWLVLERAHIVPDLEPILGGSPRPGWIGPSVFDIPHTPDGDPALDRYPEIALYPVCTTPDDTRCGPTASSP